MLNLNQLRNPVWKRSDNLRDPSVFKTNKGYHLFYSRYSNKDWSKPENWSIAQVFTKDFITFENDRDISPKGFASPGDVIFWGGRYLLPYQAYPEKPTKLCFSQSEDLISWSKPEFFLEEAVNIPWNQAQRTIDPTFVLDGDTLHCFFVGTDLVHYDGPTNLVGHAVTKDVNLRKWEILTLEEPLIGVGKNAPDGAETEVVIRQDGKWIMIYSEGLKKQHLAYALSDNLYTWELKGRIGIEPQTWTAAKYGAPFVWKEEDRWLMILMGEDAEQTTTFGLLHSKDGLNWTMLQER
jgi:sucrose-6-phosphate hydrolase SacC (GH32 family)